MRCKNSVLSFSKCTCTSMFEFCENVMQVLKHFLFRTLFSLIAGVPVRSRQSTVFVQFEFLSTYM